MGNGQRFIIFQIGIYFLSVDIQYVKEIVKNVSMEKYTNSIFILGKKLMAVPVNEVEQYCDVANDCLLPTPAILKTGKG